MHNATKACVMHAHSGPGVVLLDARPLSQSEAQESLLSESLKRHMGDTGAAGVEPVFNTLMAHLTPAAFMLRQPHVTQLCSMLVHCTDSTPSYVMLS